MLGYGRLGEVLLQGWGAYEAEVGIEGDEAPIEGAVVEGVDKYTRASYIAPNLDDLHLLSNS